MLRLIPLFFAAVVAALLFMPQGKLGGVYAMPPTRALAIIDRTDLPPLIFGEFKPAMRHWCQDDATSMWSLVGDGNIELRRFRASVTPEGDGVRVQIESLPPQGKLHDEAAESMKEDPEYADFLTAALAEQIDAKLTGREFDMKRLAAAFARVQMAAIPRIRRAADAAAKADDKRRSDAIDDAYAHEK